MSAGSGTRAWLPGVALLVALAGWMAAAATGCGEDDKRIGDDRIVEALRLERLDGGYAIRGDLFCSVEGELLNDEGEIEEALDADEEAPVITSRAGNVGIEAVPPFGPSCQKQARKGLNKLDPVPKEE